MRTIKVFFKQTLPSPLWSELVAVRRMGIRAQREVERYLCRKRRQSVHRLRALKDKHHGERCFIIGNGPSLNKMDLSQLQQEVTFGLNRIYLLFDRLGFGTTYYVSVNSLVIEQCAHEIEQLPMPKFLSWRSRNLIRFTPSTIFLDTYAAPPFARDITGPVNEGATVTYVAMQIAFYLGFSEVVLIGVDHNFATHGKPHSTVTSTGDDPNHFDPNYFGAGFRWQLPDLETSEQAYRLAKYHFEQDGREILDATVGGKLQVFRKVDYHSLFDD
jgi:hypothetical protein